MSNLSIPAGLTFSDLKKYRSMYEKTCNAILDYNQNNVPDMGLVSAWMEKVIRSNVPQNGLRNRLYVSSVYKSLVDNAPNNMLEQAFVLDWSLEYMHESNRIANNIMDNRTKLDASGTPTWHTLKNVGLMAVNDAIILKGAAYNTLKIFFGDQRDLYDQLEDLRRDCGDHYVLGRGLFEKLKKSDINSRVFTIDSYKQIVKLTFSYPSFCIPFMVAVALTSNSNIPLTKASPDLQALLLDIGYYTQLKRDVSSIFREGQQPGYEIKVNWLVIKSVERLKEKGIDLSKFEECVINRNFKEVRTLITELGILKDFVAERSALHDKIKSQIESLQGKHHDGEPMSDTFLNILMTLVKE